jgi:hypothetical protein
MTDAPSGSAALAKKAVGKAKAGGSEAGAAGKKRFEVKKVRCVDPQDLRSLTAVLIHAQWNAVALWAWDIVVDNCAICRNHIMDLCKYLNSSVVFRPLTKSRYRVSGQPSFCNQRGVYGSLGYLQCKLWSSSFYVSS